MARRRPRPNERKRPLKNLINKAKNEIKKDLKNVENKVRAKAPKLKDLIKKGKDLAKKGGEGLLLAPIIPYLPAMRVILKRKGVTPEKNMGKLVLQFKSVIVDRHNFDDVDLLETPFLMNFNAEGEEIEENYCYENAEDEEMSEEEAPSNDLGKGAGALLGAAGGAALGLPPQVGGAAGGAAGGAIQSAIRAIIQWLRNLKAKKETGKPLSDAENLALAAGEKVDMANDQLNLASGGGGIFPNMNLQSLLIPIAVLVLLYLMLRKK